MDEGRVWSSALPKCESVSGRKNRHTLLIVNPHGGKKSGLAILERIRPVFDQAGHDLELHVTRHAGHAREIARTIPVGQCDALGVLGGDGTVHEVVSGLMEGGHAATIPIGLVPAGTGNDFSMQLGIASPLDGAQRIVRGATRPFDVARVEAAGKVHYCTTIVGWGVAADINRAAERLRFLGRGRYALASLLQIVKAKSRFARLTLDQQILEDEFLLIAACNTVFVGAGMRLTPRAEVNDGKIDVVFVRRASRLEMLRLFRRVFDGSHLAMDCVEYHQVSALAIEPLADACLDLDGEVMEAAAVRVDMIPSALRFFV